MQFSIIIPLYNKSSCIEETLATVIAQTFDDFEVVVVDDGSTDGCGALVTALGDCRIRLIRQENRGVSMARNWGISSAKGQWIAFLDADDLWRPEHLEILNKQIGDNPDVDIVAGGYHPSREVSQWLKSVAGHAPSQARTELITDLPGRWMAGTCFFTSSVAVRRSTLQALPQPFAPGETFGEDLDLWFRLAEHSAVALYPRPLVGYRLGAAGSLTAAHQVTALPPYLVRMRERGLSGYPDERKARASLRFVAEQQINFARDCLAKGLRKNAVAWLAGAGRDGWRVRRWWVTVLMTLAPASVIRRWQKNRIQAGATQDD